MERRGRSDFLARVWSSVRCVANGLVPRGADLLTGFPLYWTQSPSNLGARQLADLTPSEREYCLRLGELGVTFDTKQLILLEFQPVNLKLQIGKCIIFRLSRKLLLIYSNLVFIFVEARMGMTKQDLTRRLRCMKAIYHDPPTPEVVLSDEEETLSRPSFKAAASSGDFTDSK